MFACQGGLCACFRRRCARLYTLTLIGSLGAVGCDSEAESWLTISDLRPTLGATITSGDDSTQDDLLDTAGLADGSAMLSFSARPAFCCNPLLINFTAELSVAAGSDIATAAWDFGDGRTAIGPAVQHTYRWPDEYEVVLTVRLGNGTELVDRQHLALGSDESGLNGDAAGGTALLVDAGPDQQVAGGDTVTLTGSLSRPGIAGQLQFVWSQKAGLPATLSGINSATVSFVAPEPADTTVTLLFELTVTDGDSVASDEVQITVSPLLDGIRDNTPPTAYDQSASVYQDESIVVGLTASDPDGDDLTFFVVAAPAHGTVSLIDGGPSDAATASYTPDRGFSGTDTFTIRANDGLADSNTATVTIDVLPVTSPPVVEDFAYLVPIDTPSSITLRGSAETDTELTFSISAAPRQGTLGTINNSRSQTATVIYTPNLGFRGTDTFEVVATDGIGESQRTTITVEVMKRFIPWLELNNNLGDIEDSLIGINIWSQVTDTVIITTSRATLENRLLYPELVAGSPANVRIIGGIKTSDYIPGAVPAVVDEYDFADRDAWTLIAQHARQIVEVTGTNIIVLENETAAHLYHAGQATIDYDKLKESLLPLADTGIEFWWYLPQVNYDTPGFPGRLLETTAFVTAIIDVLPGTKFNTLYASFRGWKGHGLIEPYRIAMMGLVGLENMNEMLYVTQDGYLGDRYYYNTAQATEQIREVLPTENVNIVYTGASNWVTVAEEFADLLPPLAAPIRGD